MNMLLIVGMVLTGMTARAETDEAGSRPAAFSWQQAAGRVALVQGDAVVWQFNHDPEQAVPYFHPVALPGGPVLTWLAPPDHPWHYGFWFAWKYLNGVNYWEINPNSGRQEGVTRWSNVRITTNADYSARIELVLNYQPGPEDSPVLTEARTITVSRPGRDGSYHVDWTLLFRAGDEPVVFERTPISGEPGGQSWGGYSGLIWRFAREFADWQVVNAGGARGSQCHGAKSDGCDFSGNINGQVMGVAMLDHPSNLNAPTPWYVTKDPATPFACLITAPIFHRGHRLEAGQSFTLRYRTVIHPGRWNAEQLRSAAGAFTSSSANETGREVASAPPARPNLLFCFADDWGRYAGAYAAVEDRPSVNQVVRTPNLDQIAREGVLFKNAFVPAPSCTPCRSSVLSGQYFWRTGRGAILQGAAWDPAIPSFPLLLREAGYHIGKTYKVWSPGTPVDGPFDGHKHAYDMAGRDFNDFSEKATQLVREGLSFSEARDRMLSQVRSNFEAFLQRRAPGQPFCYWFGPTLTHREFEKGSGEALWGIDPDSLKGKLPAFLPDVPEVRADFADYLGEIQAWDAGVGVLLRKLEEIGERDNTLIVVSGDHGMPGMPGGKCNLYDFGTGVALIAAGPGVPGGRVVDDFVNLMDLAPTFLEAGGVRVPEVMTGNSILPVLRSAQSGLVDSARTWVVTGRERHVGDAREGRLPYPQRALRTHDFLYIRNFAPDRWPMGAPRFEEHDEAPPARELERNTFAAFADMDASPTKAWLIGQRNSAAWRWHYDYTFGKRPAEELYDLRRDPDQVRNIADDPAYADRKRELSDQVLCLLRDTGDPRVFDDPAFDRPAFTEQLNW